MSTLAYIERIHKEKASEDIVEESTLRKEWYTSTSAVRCSRGNEVVVIWADVATCTSAHVPSKRTVVPFVLELQQMGWPC